MADHQLSLMSLKNEKKIQANGSEHWKFRLHILLPLYQIWMKTQNTSLEFALSMKLVQVIPANPANQSSQNPENVKLINR